MQAARAAAEADGKAGYKFTLNLPCYFPVMQLPTTAPCAKPSTAPTSPAHPNSARVSSAHSWTTRIIMRNPELRLEEAKLLGFRQLRRSVAGAEDGAIARRSDRLSCATWRGAHAPSLKMTWPTCASSPAANWARCAGGLGHGLRLGKAEGSSATLFSEQEVKQYFPAPKVHAGLFNIVETLFDVDIQPTPRRCGTRT